MQLARTKEWRESRGLTQRQLAAEADVGEVTVARIEAGASVTPPTARKIATALGIAVADLMERPPVPLAEAPQETGLEDVPETLEALLETLEELLERRGARTRHLVDEHLTDKLRRESVEDMARITEEVRAEIEAIGPDLVRAYNELPKTSREFQRAALLYSEVARQRLIVNLAWAEKRKQQFVPAEIASQIQRDVEAADAVLARAA
jgi:transcriptional regulator with XRE-family HTH domain